MQIFLVENGRKTGPFHLWEVRTRLDNGEVVDDTLAWHDGCEKWMPLRDLPAIGLASRAPIATDDDSSIIDTETTQAKEPMATWSAESIRPRPWARFFARVLDMIFWYTLIALCMKPFGGNFANVLVVPAWIIGAQLLMVLCETICLAMFGTTPGKAILGIHLAEHGKAPGAMNFSRASRRAFLVYILGNPLYAPGYLTMGVWIFHFVRLGKSSVTWWDQRLSIDVVSSSVTLRRGLLYAACFILLEFALQALAGEQMKPLIDAMLQSQ